MLSALKALEVAKSYANKDQMVAVLYRKKQSIITEMELNQFISIQKRSKPVRLRINLSTPRAIINTTSD